MQSLVENKPYFLEKYYFIFNGVGFYFHKPNNGYDWFVDNVDLLGTTHASIHVVSTKINLSSLKGAFGN
jgi:hypothetical protein